MAAAAAPGAVASAGPTSKSSEGMAERVGEAADVAALVAAAAAATVVVEAAAAL